MRAWLLLGRQGEDPGGLLPVLRQWVDRSENATWHLDFREFGVELPALVQVHSPSVLVFAAALNLPRALLEEILALEVGMVVALEVSQLDAYRDLAERHPLLFTQSHPTSEVIGLALEGAAAAVRRQQNWKLQVEQLHQRLNDRIVIERAKGLLVQRLGIGEEEAYKRLRILSRRQRRQIRDIAQSVLDTQALLLPPSNGTGPYDPTQGAVAPDSERTGGLPGPEEDLH
jgi:hypothetical protein